jgi:hypothetical protein
VNNSANARGVWKYNYHTFNTTSLDEAQQSGRHAAHFRDNYLQGTLQSSVIVSL